jgi:hypothetical protein
LAGYWRSLHLVSENPIDLFYPLKNSPVVKNQMRQSRSRYPPSFLIQSKFNEPPGFCGVPSGGKEVWQARPEGNQYRLMVTLVRNQVRYVIRDEGCIGQSCLDLGPKVEATPDIRCKLRSGCRTMLQKGCPQELPGYDTRIASKHLLSGVSVLYEPILIRTLPVPGPDATRDAIPYIP